jgi:hypothetical protein
MAIISVNYHIVEILAIRAIVRRARSGAQRAQNRRHKPNDVADTCGALKLFLKVAVIRSDAF